MSSSPIEPPPFNSLSHLCEGCGEDVPSDPAEVDGRVLMLCDRCWLEVMADE